MEMSGSVKELTAALVAAQRELPTITKDKLAQGTNFSYRYAGLDDVMPEALKVLNKHDLAITQTVGTTTDGGVALSTTLLHTSGEWITDEQPLLLSANDSQAQGSAITYARRYGLMSALGIVAEEDDDGNRASSQRAAAPRAAPEPRRPQAQPAEHRGSRAEPEQAAPAQGDDEGPTFAAKRDGQCLKCARTIHVGDDVQWNPEAGRKVPWHYPSCPPLAEKPPCSHDFQQNREGAMACAICGEPMPDSEDAEVEAAQAEMSV